MSDRRQNEESGVTPYGFNWGPFVVERCCHVKGRGWVLMVRVGDERLEITTSEKGRTGMKTRHVLWSSANG